MYPVAKLRIEVHFFQHMREEEGGGKFEYIKANPFSVWKTKTHLSRSKNTTSLSFFILKELPGREPNTSECITSFPHFLHFSS